MNYRHAFHAGNHADILKHLALTVSLEAFKRKDAPFAMLDAFAGPGLYDFHGDEARRSPEWEQGIAKLWDWGAQPGALAPYLNAVRAENPNGALRFYPGSPRLAAAALRPQDRLILCELHPQDCAALKRNVARAQIHQRDGFQALRAFLPFPERRGLILIDPPYEQPNELELSLACLREGLARFGHATFLWWRPLKDEARLRAADHELAAHGARAQLAARLAIGPVEPGGPLLASEIVVINPPFGLEQSLRDSLPALAKRLAGPRGEAQIYARA